MDKLNKYSHIGEEQPLIELPQLIFLLVIFFSFMIGLSLLVLPWVMVAGLLLIVAVMFGIFLNPYIGLLVFLVGALMHPAQLIGGVAADLRLARNLAFIMIFAWGIHIAVYRDFKFIKTKQYFFLGGFTLMMFLSTFRYFDFSFPQFTELIKLIILYLMVVSLIRTEKQLWVLIWFIVGLGFVTAMIGIYQQMHHIGMYDPYEGILRITGTSIDPNDYAMHIVIVFPIVIALLLNSRNVFLKVFLMLTAVILILNIAFTYSRGGVAGFFVISFLIIAKGGFSAKFKGAVAIFLLLAIVIGLPFIPQKYWNRLESMTNLNDPSLTNRFESWNGGLRMMRQHPVKGVGLGVFQYEYSEIAHTEPGYKVKIPRFAHNSYIQVGAETGILGLVFFIGLIFLSVKSLFSSAKIFQGKDRYDLCNLSRFLAVSIFGYMVCGMFLTQAFLTIFWIIAPLSVFLYDYALSYKPERIANG